MLSRTPVSSSFVFFIYFRMYSRAYFSCRSFLLSLRALILARNNIDKISIHYIILDVINFVSFVGMRNRCSCFNRHQARHLFNAKPLLLSLASCLNRELACKYKRYVSPRKLMYWMPIRDTHSMSARPSVSMASRKAGKFYFQYWGFVWQISRDAMVSQLNEISSWRIEQAGIAFDYHEDFRPTSISARQYWSTFLIYVVMIKPVSFCGISHSQ